MGIKQISKRLVISGSLLILTIKFIIRPLYLPDDSIRFFLGISPNLFGSFLVPFGVYWLLNHNSFTWLRNFKIHSLYDMRIVCLTGFGMLIINEYLQRIPVFGRTFDYFDIAFSAIGLTTAYFVFGKIQQRYQLQRG